MSSLLLRFEAVESRIASYSCPRGIPGRVHSLRLRRCFQSTTLRAVPSANSTPPLPQHGGYNGIAIALSDILAQPPQVPKFEKDMVKYKGSHQSGTTDHVPRYGPPRYRHMRNSIVLDDIVPFDPEVPAADLATAEEAKIYSALRTGNPHAVMRSLMNIVQLESHGYPSPILVSAPPPTFSEILRCIDPKYFVDPYAAVFQQISSVSTRLLGAENILGDEDYYEFCSAFLAQAGRIMNARRQRWPLSLSDYKYLLKCAKAVGHSSAAESIWQTMTTLPKPNEGERVIPDAEAFNHYLAVKCWQDRMNPKHRYRLRVIEENFTPRSWLIPPHTLNSHRVGPQGIKYQAARLFRDMVELGVTGNEETFCLMIIALGREGDLAGAASILHRVWNIDVEAIMETDDSDIPPPTAYGPRSPFFPSSHLLYSIAHAYGSNNDISTALRLVDFVSRHYSISIPLNVWNELLQWTSVVSNNRRLVRKKHGIEKPTGRDAGQLPREAVSNLWQTMISEPYNVKPTIPMYNRLISNLAARQRIGEIQLRMEEARSVLKDEIRSLSKREVSYLTVLKGKNKKSLIEARARDLMYARFRVWRNRQYVKRWIRILLRCGSAKLRFNEQWTSQNIPDIMHGWIVFLPDRVQYKISTGQVSFWSGTKQVKRWKLFRLQRRARRQADQAKFWNESNDLDENTADLDETSRKQTSEKIEMDR